MAWYLHIKYDEFIEKQSLQRYTRHVNILYSPNSPNNMTEKKAEELAKQFRLAKFQTNVQSFSEYDVTKMLDGANLLLFVVDNGSDIKDTMHTKTCAWLEEEAVLRITEGCIRGVQKNIVYTPEGFRRTAFLRVKYAVYGVNSKGDSIPSDRDPSSLIDAYMSDFGALQIVPAGHGEQRFAAWTQALKKKLATVVINPESDLPNRTPADQEPFLPLHSFGSWLFACPCCSRLEVEKSRVRPSDKHIGTFDFAWWVLTDFSGEALRAVVRFNMASFIGWVDTIFFPMRADLVALWGKLNNLGRGLFVALDLALLYIFKDIIWANFPSWTTVGLYSIPVAMYVTYNFWKFSFRAYSIQGCWHVPFVSPAHDDGEINDALKASTVTPTELQTMVASPGYQYYEDGSDFVPPSRIYSRQYVARDFAGAPLVAVKHAGNHVPAVYSARTPPPRGQRPEPETGLETQLISVLKSLRAGEPLPKAALSLPADVIKSLILRNIFVPRNYWSMEIKKWDEISVQAGKDIMNNGYCFFEELLHPTQLYYLREYSRKLFVELGDKEACFDNARTTTTWNDEPYGRYLNQELTKFMSGVVNEPLLHPGLLLIIYIVKGPGFVMHRDSNPPFDVTLDLVIDHQGPYDRPVNFVKRNPQGKGGVGPETMALKWGQSVAFRGAEIPHYGGDLENGLHTVMLFTWSYARD
eukprot:TRINITY_DN780_c0_g2_i2.p1 TRINITY_DN780_c0_g2~~TRINITY_DN780_c0_g2_i2.p1  ORF type:complete len:785 (-),score=212.39 TRINITY_DN780_c0_g2_i2:165-2246(-)